MICCTHIPLLLGSGSHCSIAYFIEIKWLAFTCKGRHEIVVFLFCQVENWAQGSIHARQVLLTWAACLSLGLCLSVFDLFQLMWCFSSPSMWLCIINFLHCYGWMIYTIYSFVHLSVISTSVYSIYVTTKHSDVYISSINFSLIY